MDILRKMFSKSSDDADSRGDNKDGFRKPSWYEEEESDDELFDGDRKFMFQIFTNPIELQKHFDLQMKEILKSMRDFEDSDQHSPKEEYLKPGFEKEFMEEFHKNSKGLDTDLDGEIYADQLHSLLQRISPDVEWLPRNDGKQQHLHQKKKLSDVDQIMGKIHGTIVDEESTSVKRRKEVAVPRMPPHFGGVFEGTYQGPRMFGQSIMSQTVRKPDGTYETKKVIRDSDGSTKTVITRIVDGKPETSITYDNGTEKSSTSSFQTIKPKAKEELESPISSDRNLYVSKQGYALPKNLW